MSGVAVKMKSRPPAYAELDAKAAARLGTEIVKEGPYIVKPYVNSKGVTFLNVQDTTRDRDQRRPAVTVRDDEEWRALNPRKRREHS